MYNDSHAGRIPSVIASDISRNSETLIASDVIRFLDSRDTTLYGTIIYGSDFDKYVQTELPQKIEEYKNSYGNTGSQPASVSVFQLTLSDQIHILCELITTSFRKLPIAFTVFNKISNDRTDFRIEAKPNTSVSIELLKNSVDLTSNKTTAEEIIGKFIKESDQQREAYQLQATFPNYYRRTLPEFLHISIEASLLYDENETEDAVDLPELPKAIQDYMLSYL